VWRAGHLFFPEAYVTIANKIYFIDLSAFIVKNTSGIRKLGKGV
jgi:hypothetical protein